jgi:hypothetical protein
MPVRGVQDFRRGVERRTKGAETGLNLFGDSRISRLKSHSFFSELNWRYLSKDVDRRRTGKPHTDGVCSRQINLVRKVRRRDECSLR